MLIASGWTLRVRWFQREPAFNTRTSVPASGPVRRLAPVRGTIALPPGGSVTASMLCRSGSGRCATREAPLSFRHLSDRCRNDLLTALPLAASAVRQIPTEVFLRRVFQHCCGHRCQIARFMFSLSVTTVSHRNLKCGSTLSTPESCACGPSRAREIDRRKCRYCGQVGGWTCASSNSDSPRNLSRWTEPKIARAKARRRKDIYQAALPP